MLKAYKIRSLSNILQMGIWKTTKRKKGKDTPLAVSLLELAGRAGKQAEFYSQFHHCKFNFTHLRGLAVGLEWYGVVVVGRRGDFGIL